MVPVPTSIALVMSIALSNDVPIAAGGASAPPPGASGVVLLLLLPPHAAAARMVVSSSLRMFPPMGAEDIHSAASSSHQLVSEVAPGHARSWDCRRPARRAAPGPREIGTNRRAGRRCQRGSAR